MGNGQGQDLSQLLTIMDEVNSLLNTEQTLHHIVDQVVRQFHCKTCAIVQLNPETELLEIRNFQNLSWNFCKAYHRPIDNPVMNDLIWKGKTISISNPESTDDRANSIKMEHEFASALAVQLIGRQQPLGFFYVDSDKPDAFTTEIRQQIELYAGLISTSLLMERQSAQLRQLRSEDEDSGAMRFEHYYALLEEHFHRSRRLQENYSLLLIDIEGYGAMLKTYGLELVRQILRELVESIKSNLPANDEIARFGADEFLVVLPGTTSAEALKTAQKLAKLINTKQFSEQNLPVNVFIGVANFPENCTTLNGLLIGSKNGLLQAKRMSGKLKIAAVNEMYD